MELHELELFKRQGSGQAVFMISRFQHEDGLVPAVFQALAWEAEVFWYKMQSCSPLDWNVLAQGVAGCAKHYKLPQISLISFDGLVDLLLEISLLDHKLLRRAAVIEPEAACTKSLLHRIRCPVLIITTSQSSEAQETEAQFLAQAVPTAWHVMATGDEQQASDCMLDALRRFLKVPAKCPQRRRMLNA